MCSPHSLRTINLVDACQLTSQSLPATSAVLIFLASTALPLLAYPLFFTTEHVYLPTSELPSLPKKTYFEIEKGRKKRKSSSRPRTHPFNLILNSRIRWEWERWSTPFTTCGRRRHATRPSRGTPTPSSRSSRIPSSRCGSGMWWRISVSHASGSRDGIINWLWCTEDVFLACSSGHAERHAIEISLWLRVVEDRGLRLITMNSSCWRNGVSLRKVGRRWYIWSTVGAIS